MEVFELLGAGTVRTRLQVSAARGLTRFIGRDAELDQLRAALERARSGRGQVVALVGEPGVGKSRLVLELAHSHRTDGWLVLESSAVSYGKAASLLPGRRADEGLLRRRGSGRHAPRAGEADRQAPHARRGASARARPPSRRSSTCRSTTRRGSSSAPSAQRKRILDAVRRVLLRESQAQPLLLVLEDLHWIDADTQALLESLLESLPSYRLLLLRQLPARVPARLGRQDLLRPDPSRSAGGRLRPMRSSKPSGRRSGARAAEDAPDRARAGQPVLPGGERARARRDRACSPASAAHTVS